MAETLLEVKNLSKRFVGKQVTVHAVSDVSFCIEQGQTIGIVGESGCGKTTLGRSIVRAIDASEGSVLYRSSSGEVVDFLTLTPKQLKPIRKEIQMIFQDPYSSLDPRMTVLDIISEPLKANYPKMKKCERERLVMEIAEKTGLNPSYLKRYPHAFSGPDAKDGLQGHWSINPRLIVCDEAVSALSPPSKPGVNLLRTAARDGLTYMFISHDCLYWNTSRPSRVMYLDGWLNMLLPGSCTPSIASLSEALLSSVPIADPTITVQKIPLVGEIPNPANPPTGCFFHPRCRYCTEICKQESPQFKEQGKGHFVACHHSTELKLQGIAQYA
jgi:peptide/nickel transport system ATP-binding protein